MKNIENTSLWEIAPNDLFASKIAFSGTPRPTKDALNKLSPEDIEEIDNFFKERRKLPENKRNKKGTPFMPKALSEIFFNKEGTGVYCFDGIILPDEDYDNLDNLRKKADYTVMLLTEKIKQDVCSVLTSPQMNEVFEMKEMKLHAEKRLKKRQEAKAKRDATI
jgi:hypothetical protein